MGPEDKSLRKGKIRTGPCAIIVRISMVIAFRYSNGVAQVSEPR